MVQASPLDQAVSAPVLLGLILFLGTTLYLEPSQVPSARCIHRWLDFTVAFSLTFGSGNRLVSYAFLYNNQINARALIG